MGMSFEISFTKPALLSEYVAGVAGVAGVVCNRSAEEREPCDQVANLPRLTGEFQTSEGL